MKSLCRNSVCHISNLPEELVFRILLLLPGNLLFKIRSVCKAWFNLIDSSAFVEAQIRNNETGLIFLRQTAKGKIPSFCIEENGLMSEHFSLFEQPSRNNKKSYLCFLKFQDGECIISESSIRSRGSILASCNGLLLGTIPPCKGLVVINPVTGKLIRIPFGTIVKSDHESYGFMFSHYTSDYKVVHLFWDQRGYVGCEIFSLTTRSWHAVYGTNLSLLNRSLDMAVGGAAMPMAVGGAAMPMAVDDALMPMAIDDAVMPNPLRAHGGFNRFLHKPVSALGAMYWLRRGGSQTNIVSLSIVDEKFRAIALPITSTPYCRILEFCGSLSFVTHVTLHTIQVWILSGSLDEVRWTRQYSIVWIQEVRNLLPFFASRNGKQMVFTGHGHNFYAYDFDDESMKRIELNIEEFPKGGTMLPYCTTLASW